MGKLKAAAKKLERELKSARITKASHIYLALSKAPGEEMLFLYLTSEHRLVQDRIKHYSRSICPPPWKSPINRSPIWGLRPELQNSRNSKRV